MNHRLLNPEFREKRQLAREAREREAARRARKAALLSGDGDATT
jgi:hypothetical protein